MNDSTFRKRLRLEYFVACCLAIAAALAGLFNPSAHDAKLFINPPALLGFIIIALGATGLFFFVMQKRRPTPGAEPVIPIASTRMVKMAFLWYGLSVVLSFALVRQPLSYTLKHTAVPPTAGEWILGAVGLLLTCIAVLRALRMYKSKFFEQGRKFDQDNLNKEENDDEQPQNR